MEAKKVRGKKKLSKEEEEELKTQDILNKTKPLVHPKRKHCVQAIRDGYVESFIELFRQVHREPVLVDPIAETYFSIPDEKIPFLKEKLCEVEQSKRIGEFSVVFNALKELADYYESVGDVETSFHYLQMGLFHSHQSGDKKLECLANECLGLAYARSGRQEEALKYHEEQLRLAEYTNDEEDLKRAREEVIGLYYKQGAAVEESDHTKAISYYEKAYDVARASQNYKEEGVSQHKISNLYLKDRKFEPAVEAEKKYLESCRRLNNVEGEGEALTCLASIYDEMGDTSSAIECLEGLLDLAVSSGNKEAEAEACRTLGVLYNKMENFEKSVEYFDRNFLLAKEIGDKAVVDKAKILLGLAKGNSNFSTFMNIVEKDMFSLLLWKEKRVPFKT